MLTVAGTWERVPRGSSLGAAFVGGEGGMNSASFRGLRRVRQWIPDETPSTVTERIGRASAERRARQPFVRGGTRARAGQCTCARPRVRSTVPLEQGLGLLFGSALSRVSAYGKVSEASVTT